MRPSPLSRRRRERAAGFLLAMLLFRAYVPLGFMPASGAPFLLELCPEASAMPLSTSMAMPMAMPMPASTATTQAVWTSPASMAMPMSMPMPMSASATPTPMPMPVQPHHHGGGHAHFDHCPFGSATAAGPVSDLIAVEPCTDSSPRRVVAFEALRLGVRLDRAHQPRGPPSLA